MPVPKAYLAVIALGAAAVAVRSAQPGFRREANVGAIGRELAAAAAAAGYRTRIGKGGALTIEVRAQHGPCQRHLFAFNPDGSEVAKIQGRFPGQPMIFHWGAQRSDRFPRPWPLLATYAKGYVRTFGINFPIPPLVAEVAGSACASAPAIRFDRLRYPLE